MNLLPLLYLIPYVIGQLFPHHQEINDIKNGNSGAFTSPGYPGKYPNNAHYTWTLKTGDSNATVLLNITDFSVVKYRYTSKCEDYLQIERKKPNYALIIKRCGEFAQINLNNTGDIFVITFVSDGIHNARGFFLSWKVYIPATTTTKQTGTTTKTIPTTRTTEKTTINTTEEQTTTTTETNKTTTSRTTTQNPKTKKSIREIHTLPSDLLTSNQKQTRTHTNSQLTRNTEAYVANKKAHSTTETLTKTDLMKTTTILITTQQITDQNKTIETLGTKEIDTSMRGYRLFAHSLHLVTLYLVAGIGVVELTLVALGIYIVKQRRANRRQLDTRKPDKGKYRPVSRKSVASVGNIYESIPMEHFSIKDAIPEEDENVYTEVPEHMYDKTFEHRPRVNVNANLYQLLLELKTKNK